MKEKLESTQKHLSVVQKDLRKGKDKVAKLQGQLEKEKDEAEKSTGESEQLKEQLGASKTRYDSLRSKHDAEVKELFENKTTLRFIKEMKKCKKEWAEKTGDEDRKQVATQMASTTKNWVSKDENPEEKVEE